MKEEDLVIKRIHELCDLLVNDEGEFYGISPENQLNIYKVVLELKHIVDTNNIDQSVFMNDSYWKIWNLIHNVHTLEPDVSLNFNYAIRWDINFELKSVKSIAEANHRIHKIFKSYMGESKIEIIKNVANGNGSRIITGLLIMYLDSVKDFTVLLNNVVNSDKSYIKKLLFKPTPAYVRAVYKTIDTFMVCANPKALLNNYHNNYYSLGSVMYPVLVGVHTKNNVRNDYYNLEINLASFVAHYDAIEANLETISTKLREQSFDVLETYNVDTNDTETIAE